MNSEKIMSILIESRTKKVIKEAIDDEEGIVI